jgi:hypothetical protein
MLQINDRRSFSPRGRRADNCSLRRAARGQSAHVPHHQTLRLAVSSHASTAGGEVCAAELASILAGEPLSDHPKSVCRVIAAFLREYNDAVDDRRRQQLRACVAAVVGTRSSRAVERARVDLCAATLRAVRGKAPRPNRWRPSTAGPMRRELLAFRLARRLARRRDGSELALALVHELVAIDERAGPRPGVPDDEPTSSVRGVTDSVSRPAPGGNGADSGDRAPSSTHVDAPLRVDLGGRARLRVRLSASRHRVAGVERRAWW